MQIEVNAVKAHVAGTHHAHDGIQIGPVVVTKTACIMNDFGKQNDSMLKMWERVKKTSLPLWAYILLLVLVILLTLFLIMQSIYNHQKKRRRKLRKMERLQKSKKSDELIKTLTENL